MSTTGHPQETNMETVIIEIRAAEGGDDAKTLVEEQLVAYVNVAVRRCL
jgi:protein subunit release factor A